MNLPKAALHNSMETLDLALKSSGMGVWQWDIVENTRVFDDQTCSLLGIDPATFRGTAGEFIAAVHPDDREKIRDHWTQTIENDAPYAPEYRVIWPDGTVHYICARGSFIRNEAGLPLRITGVLWDVTSQKQAQEELYESEEKYRLIFSHETDAIVLTSADSLKFLSVNDAAVSLYGYTKEEFLNMTPLDLSAEPGESKETLHAGAIDSRTRVPLRWHRKKDGTVFPVEISAGPFTWKNQRVVCSIIRDITERRDAEEALRESEEKYRAIFEGTAQGIVIVDVETKQFKYVNPSICRMLGYTESEMLQLYIADVHPKESLDQVISEFEAVGRGDRRLSTALPCLRKDGTVFYADIVSAPSMFMGRRKCNVAFFADVTERKLAEEELEKYRLLAENSRDIMLFVRMDGHIVEANAAAVSTYGYSRRELLGMTIFDLRASWVVEDARAQMAEADFGGILFETTHRRKDGSCFDVEVSSRGTEVGGQRLLLSVIRDITERKQAEEALQNEKNNLAAIFASSPVGMLLMDEEMTIVSANSVIAGMLSKSTSEIVDRRGGSGLGCIHSTENKLGCGHSGACRECPFRQGITQVLKSGTSIHDVEIHANLVVDGNQCNPWLRVSAEPVTVSGRKHVIIAVDDVTEQKQARDALIQAKQEAEKANSHLVSALTQATKLASEAEQAKELIEEKAVELGYQANHDALTDLPNRQYFERYLNDLTVDRGESCPFTVLFLDLDKFKLINDTLGHKVGDLLLVEVASRLPSCLRSEDVLARMGGDEFTVILPCDLGREAVESVASRMIESISRPFNIRGHKFTIGASIGLADYPSDGTDAVTLLKHADAAMYKAKQAGRGRFRWFTGDVDVENQQRAIIEMDIRSALEDGQFKVFYQPIVSLTDPAICSAEALLRWEHPEKGMISPSLFIPIAEEIGLIGSIGDYVLRTACSQAAAWRDKGICLAKVGVNVSTMQVRDPDWLDSVRAALSDSGLDSEYLSLELTETDFATDYDSMRKTLLQVQRLGAAISIDDFGMGQSSLSRLKDFPVIHLKVDGSFIRDIEHSESDKALLRSIIEMAHGQGILVTAEWVETESQMRILRDCGCDFAQGYYFSPALSADDFREFALRRSASVKPIRQAA